MLLLQALPVHSQALSHVYSQLTQLLITLLIHLCTCFSFRTRYEGLLCLAAMKKHGHGTTHMAHITLPHTHMAHDTWHNTHGTCYMTTTTCMAPPPPTHHIYGTWYIAEHTWHMVHSKTHMAHSRLHCRLVCMWQCYPQQDPVTDCFSMGMLIWEKT